MNRELITTRDGSHTIVVPGMNITYHSVHGAILESLHVFIGAGFRARSQVERTGALQILEVGLGTGLNALLTLIAAETERLRVHYTALEPFPLSVEEIKQLNYCELLYRPDLKPVLEQIHTGDWEKEVSIKPGFILQKTRAPLLQFNTEKKFELIYFDAFAPSAQPELWSLEIFERMFKILTGGGILVTYCSKGEVRRALQKAGFSVEKIPGPPGKREMIRAAKKAPAPSGISPSLS